MIATEKENKATAWLRSFPLHWKVLRIKNLFFEIDSRSEGGNEELLSVSHYTGVTLKKDGLENEDDHLTNAESLIGYKKVVRGDLVINIMLAWNGSLGISPYNGITSPAYCVYRVKGDNNPEYFGYLFTTSLFKAEFRKSSTGIIDSRLRLYSDKFFSIFSVVPPKEEQDGIVQYIKSQEDKINLFIQKKYNFIELLKEQRQSIANNFIIRGVNNNVNYKNSGIDLLDKIPKHWDVIRLKYLFTEISNKSEDGEGLLLMASQVYGLVPRAKYHAKAEAAQTTIGHKLCCVGDLVFNKLKAHLGVCFESQYDGLVSPDYAVYRPCKGVNSKYFEFLFRHPAFIRQFIIRSTGIVDGLIRLYTSELFAIAVPLPPIEEQNGIIEQIEIETRTINVTIAKAEQEIELIKEYREAMIAEAVMGKLDMRQV